MGYHRLHWNVRQHGSVLYLDIVSGDSKSRHTMSEIGHYGIYNGQIYASFLGGADHFFDSPDDAKSWIELSAKSLFRQMSEEVDGAESMLDISHPDRK